MKKYQHLSTSFNTLQETTDTKKIEFHGEPSRAHFGMGLVIMDVHWSLQQRKQTLPFPSPSGGTIPSAIIRTCLLRNNICSKFSSSFFTSPVCRAAHLEPLVEPSEALECAGSSFRGTTQWTEVATGEKTFGVETW